MAAVSDAESQAAEAYSKHLDAQVQVVFYIIITGQVLDVLRVGQDVSPNNCKSGVSISGHIVYMYVGTSDSELSDRNYSVVRPRAQR